MIKPEKIVSGSMSTLFWKTKLKLLIPLVISRLLFLISRRCHLNCAIIDILRSP